MKNLFLIFKKRLRFLRSLERFISNIPLGVIQVFYIFSSKYILKSKFLNLIGCQTFRIKLADRLLKRRRRLLNHRNLLGQKIDLNFLSTLEADGILEVERALPMEMFVRLNNTVDQIKNDQIDYKHFVKAGAEYREVVVKESDPELYDYLTTAFWVKDLAKTYLGKTNLKLEWRIKLIRDYDGSFDNNTLWHADTFFNTLKAFIYLNDVDSSKDVYNYFVGSHIMTPDVLKLHYRYSSNALKQPWPNKCEIDAFNFP